MRPSTGRWTTRSAERTVRRDFYQADVPQRLHRAAPLSGFWYGAMRHRADQGTTVGFHNRPMPLSSPA